MEIALQYPYLIPLLPLIAAVISGFFGARLLKGQSHWPIWIGVGISAFLSLSLLAFALNSEEKPEHQAAVVLPATDPSTTAPSATEPASKPTTLPATMKADESGPATSEGKPTAQAGEVSKFPIDYPWFNWISLGKTGGTGADAPFSVDFGFYIDHLTVVMLSVICGIGFLITIFAAGYMKGEAGYFRFFAYLGLFIFMMTCLVMGKNLIMLYLGWEGVGLSSYLLIGYYYDKPAAREAAKKAFLVNRIGDFGFALGIMLCYSTFGTVTYFDGGHGLLELAAKASPEQTEALMYIPFLLMLGAFGKSAQFPLYVWLPDAMEGPTPVSALIHAATMVTAGIYMIARCGSLFVSNEYAMLTIGIVGAFTALFAGTIALRQFDLKKVFAYSTVSQLGFMFVGLAALAPVAAVFHLITHAFFKALLFLSSGVVMHAMGGILDMRQMSGLKRVLPKTRWLMLIGCLALAGFPAFSGFFSKDEIIGNAFHAGTFGRVLLGLVMLFTAFLTAYYTFRLYFRVFEGPLVVPEAPAHGHGHGQDDAAHGGHGNDDHGHGGGHHNHEPLMMILPLIILAIGAFAAGYINWPAERLSEFLGQSQSFKLAWQVAEKHYGTGEDGVVAASFGQPEAHTEEHTYVPPVMILSALIAVAGIFLAYILHLRDRMRAERLAAGLTPLVGLLEAKYWVDEIYDELIVQPLRKIGEALADADRLVVDGVVNAISWVPQIGGWALKLGIQRGSLQGYASSMLFGLLVILVLVFWS